MTLIELDRNLKLVESAIRQAGVLLRDIARRPLDVLNADGKDIKLQADRDSEQLIIDALRAGSDYPILCEERGEIGAESGANFDGKFWVIDPLDGTLNFSRGIPTCCISIALVDGSGGAEKPLVGAILDFNRDELFTAAAGQGAWLNGAPMHVSDVTDPAQGVISTGFPSSADYSTEGLLPLIRRVQQFKKVRMIGAAAVSLAWVACGRIDAYAEDNTMLWDVAAGVLLVAEAGGTVELSESPKKKWARNVKVGSSPRIWPAEA